MGIVDEDIERLRSTVSIVDTVQQYVALKRVGRNWVGLCPFHAEKSGSFNVREETGRYKCFGCDKGGDVFTFIQEIEHLDFPGAVEHLAAKAGIQLNYTTTGQSKERARRKQLVEAMGEAVEWYHQRLLTDPDARAARDYLRRRGLAGDIARQFKLGWAPDDWDALSRDLGASADDAAGGRAGVPQPAQQDAGLVPGSGDVPDLLRVGRSAGVRRPDPARLRRPGEVQELLGDADLHEVEDRSTGSTGRRPTSPSTTR